MRSRLGRRLVRTIRIRSLELLWSDSRTLICLGLRDLITLHFQEVLSLNREELIGLDLARKDKYHRP